MMLQKSKCGMCVLCAGFSRNLFSFYLFIFISSCYFYIFVMEEEEQQQQQHKDKKPLEWMLSTYGKINNDDVSLSYNDDDNDNLLSPVGRIRLNEIIGNVILSYQTTYNQRQNKSAYECLVYMAHEYFFATNNKLVKKEYDLLARVFFNSTCGLRLALKTYFVNNNKKNTKTAREKEDFVLILRFLVCLCAAAHRQMTWPTDRRDHDHRHFSQFGDVNSIFTSFGKNSVLLLLVEHGFKEILDLLFGPNQTPADIYDTVQSLDANGISFGLCQLLRAAASKRGNSVFIRQLFKYLTQHAPEYFTKQLFYDCFCAGILNPLHAAAKCGDLDNVRALVDGMTNEYNSSTNRIVFVRWGGHCANQIIVPSSHRELSRFLLVAHNNSRQISPLLCAVENGRVSVATWIFDQVFKQTKPTREFDYEPSFKNPSLLIQKAIESNRPEMVDLVLSWNSLLDYSNLLTVRDLSLLLFRAIETSTNDDIIFGKILVALFFQAPGDVHLKKCFFKREFLNLAEHAIAHHSTPILTVLVKIMSGEEEEKIVYKRRDQLSKVGRTVTITSARCKQTKEMIQHLLKELSPLAIFESAKNDLLYAADRCLTFGYLVYYIRQYDQLRARFFHDKEGWRQQVALDERHHPTLCGETFPSTCFNLVARYRLRELDNHNPHYEFYDRIQTKKAINVIIYLHPFIPDWVLKFHAVEFDKSKLFSWRRQYVLRQKIKVLQDMMADVDDFPSFTKNKNKKKRKSEEDDYDYKSNSDQPPKKRQRVSRFTAIADPCSITTNTNDTKTTTSAKNKDFCEFVNQTLLTSLFEWLWQEEESFPPPDDIISSKKKTSLDIYDHCYDLVMGVRNTFLLRDGLFS